MERILRELARDPTEWGDLDLSKCFIEVVFVISKKGARGGKDQAAKGSEVKAVTDSEFSADHTGIGK